VKLIPHPGPFRISLGECGEREAACFLEKQGYKILERNYKCRIGEIDVIARRKGRIAFVEIKTRTSVQFGTPQEAVDLKKQKKIFKLAQWYLKEKKLEKESVAFDVVAVLWRGDGAPQMRLIADAFEKGDERY